MRTRTSTYRFVIEPLEQRRLLSSGGAIGVWTGLGDGVNWHDPLNWSQNTMPGISDDVVIDVPDFPTILVNQPVAVRSITSNEALDLSSNLGVEQSSQFNAPVMLRGTFAGAGDATFASTLDWYSGTFEPGGKIIIAAGAEMNIDIPGGPQDVLTHELYRSLDNYGTVNLIAGDLAVLALDNCILDNKAGAAFNITGGSVFLSGNTAVIVNSGTLSIGPTTRVGFTSRFDNNGTTVVKGELNLHLEGTGGGEFIVEGRANFLSGYDLLQSSWLTGPGIIGFYSDAIVDGDVSDLNLLAVATTADQGVTFNGRVAVDHLLCINESVLPERLIATFNDLTDVGELRIIDGAVRFNSALTAENTQVESFQLGAGLLELSGSESSLGDLLIDNSTVRLTSSTSPSRSLRIESLISSGSWSLDLGNGAMIVDYDGASPLSEIRAALTSGYASGAWNGMGINSSDASFSTNHALGYAEASDLFEAFPALFAGQEVDDTSILVRHTLYGDANLDMQVDLSDFNRLAANFGASNTVWSQGNYNYDINTNLPDFDLLAGNFGHGVGGSIFAGSRIADAGDDRLAELI